MKDPFLSRRDGRALRLLARYFSYLRRLCRKRPGVVRRIRGEPIARVARRRGVASDGHRNRILKRRPQRVGDVHRRRIVRFLYDDFN